MGDLLRFDGRVVVVTGAGAGLGRAYALMFGERGASVVVNDLGGSRHGDGSSTNAADTVVQEIRNKGGKAVADYNSVEDGDKLIKTALDNFGRVDVVVNNAGILRDKSFPRISDTDWDLVNRVHVKGTFKTTQAAWPHFKKQGYGRIIVTSSTSGLHGNFGQANYSAAKMAVVGLCNTLAIEGRKYNINSNVIVPMAASRLTEDIMPPEVLAELRPELIAPVVVWLCHESCKENGSVVSSAAGWAGKYHLVRSPGTVLRAKITDDVTPENVRDNWGRVTDMSAAKHYTSNAEVTASVMGSLETLRTGPDSNASAITSEDTLSYDKRDVILYAFGIGATVSNSEDLKYLYEGHEEFSVVPTFFILPAIITLMGSSITLNALPGKDVSPANVLHGEQYLEIFKPLSMSGNLRSRAKIADVLDKGSGAVVIVDVETFDDKGEKVAYNQATTFVVGAGGFKGKRVSDKAVLPINAPSRDPDAVIKQQTSVDQAALYRLSGDWNPLHIDSSIAAMGGFTRPILHGLCSLGFSVRHVLQHYANNDASKFKAVKVRFVKPVYPGQTLQTNMWQEGKRIHFETKVAETGTTVISGAYVDLTVAPATKKSPANESQSVVSKAGLKSDAVFEGLKLKIDANLEKARKINGVFVYNITLDGKKAATWTIDLKKGSLYPGPPKDTKADCTLTLGDSDFVDLAAGKLNPQLAFMQGKLKIQGNIMLSQKLRDLMKEESKL